MSKGTDCKELTKWKAEARRLRTRNAELRTLLCDTLKGVGNEKTNLCSACRYRTIILRLLSRAARNDGRGSGECTASGDGSG